MYGARWAQEDQSGDHCPFQVGNDVPRCDEAMEVWYIMKENRKDWLKDWAS